MKPQERIARLEERRQQITNRIARLRNAERTKERKRRTRRLILIGTCVESKTKDDPDARDRLLKDLDGFLSRPRDRELFDLPPLRQTPEGKLRESR